MSQRKTLNDVQVVVLRWIGEGCPDNGIDGISTRISAGALRNRGLVRTTGRGATWRATITAAGKEYLQRVDGPNPPLPRQPNVPVTQQLVDDVVAAGGTLRLPRKRRNDTSGVDYERRALLAESYGKVPRGSRLVIKTVSADELLIELVTDTFDSAGSEAPAPMELLPVQVPEAEQVPPSRPRVPRPHQPSRGFTQSPAACRANRPRARHRRRKTRTRGRMLATDLVGLALGFAFWTYANTISLTLEGDDLAALNELATRYDHIVPDRALAKLVHDTKDG